MQTKRRTNIFAVRRMSARDYEAFVASLKKIYPDDAFLIVRFGDHPPAIGASVWSSPD